MPAIDPVCSLYCSAPVTGPEHVFIIQSAVRILVDGLIMLYCRVILTDSPHAVRAKPMLFFKKALPDQMLVQIIKGFPPKGRVVPVQKGLMLSFNPIDVTDNLF